MTGENAIIPITGTIISLDIKSSSGSPTITVFKNASKNAEIIYKNFKDTPTYNLSPDGLLSININAVQVIQKFQYNLVIGKKSYSNTPTIGISLPLDIELETFKARLSSGDLLWSGPNVKQEFSATLSSGDIRFTDDFATRDLKLQSSSGDMKLNAEIRVSNEARLELHSGDVKGNLRGYNQLHLITHSGDINLSLYPGSENSQGIVESNSGDVKLNILEFQGRFDFSTHNGDVRVQAPGGITKKANPCSGVVGETESKGSIGISSKNGDVNVQFLG
ncbi:hypothetical protein HK100_001398 [Physocladia obscura]|uniref:DUF4097 domain-containing protein n=1 Tax=Physocladia obscura TaxID=109957 RepID=A0AAD5T8A7_9FUNG|nr:hypothetical protein HK100_001398 [Physocladia obscura]